VLFDTPAHGNAAAGPARRDQRALGEDDADRSRRGRHGQRPWDGTGGAQRQQTAARASPPRRRVGHQAILQPANSRARGTPGMSLAPGRPSKPLLAAARREWPQEAATSAARACPLAACALPDGCDRRCGAANSKGCACR